jgi:hypothetical protein
LHGKFCAAAVDATKRAVINIATRVHDFMNVNKYDMINLHFVLLSTAQRLPVLEYLGALEAQSS